MLHVHSAHAFLPSHEHHCFAADMGLNLRGDSSGDFFFLEVKVLATFFTHAPHNNKMEMEMEMVKM
jgi:hypothetical protein